MPPVNEFFLLLVLGVFGAFSLTLAYASIATNRANK